MTLNRILNWDGCNNVRDLGGFNAANGHKTRWGAIVRGDHPAKLTADGWSALYEHGIRTIISLHTYGLDETDYLALVPQRSDIETVKVAIEDFTDSVFIEKWVNTDLWCTPLYYHDALTRWSQRHAEALKAIAQAKPGGVLFHCKRGYDRTGIIAFLVLALAGVSPEDIFADYVLSVDSYREELLAQRNTTTREVIFSTLASLDVEDVLREGGLSQVDLEAFRNRFLEPE
jgi:protein tyrosine/serine phosphatase